MYNFNLCELLYFIFKPPNKVPKNTTHKVLKCNKICLLTSSPPLFLAWLLLLTCAGWAVTVFDEAEGITTLKFLWGNSSNGSFLLTMPATVPRTC
jgi:hypothetical protein